MAKRWRMEVENTFMITGRGLIVVGMLEGVARQGEAATVHTKDASFEIDHVSFDTLCGGRPGLFGFVLRGVRQDQVPIGAVVESHD